MSAAKNPIYLDYHATTPLDPVVTEAMRPWWEEKFGNPHSGSHWFGWQAHEAVEVARENVAGLIGADVGEIVFTSGATEANNIALLGASRAVAGRRNQIFVSAIEHRSVAETAMALGSTGWQIEEIPVDKNGLVRLDVLETMLGDRTALVSIMAVNNEIGIIQPIEQIGHLCHDVGAWFHCDAAQAPAAMSIDILASQIDLLSLSSHKIYGPKGIGALYVDSYVLSQLQPVSYGGGQEQGIRSGTLPTPLCVGFGIASTLMSERQSADFARILRLRAQLWEGIESLVPCAVLNGSLECRHPGNLNVCFKGHDASAVLGSLQPTLAASTGSTCSTGAPEPSHVLTAIGLSLQEAKSSIRFCIGRFTSEEEIERAIRLLEEAFKRAPKSIPRTK